MFHGLRHALFAILALWASAACAQDSGSRLALVIGNSDYSAAPLPTATNDAGLIATALMQAGFDVTAGADADMATSRKLVEAFTAKARAASDPNTIIIVYLTGYGLQTNGDNFLVPIGARIPRDIDVPAGALPLADLARSLETVPAKARIFIYDLAHDTPFAKGGTPLASGLSLVEARPGALVALNTAPGTVAPADVATYGTYARVLSDLLALPGLPAAVLFERLRLRVTQITNGSTVPWDDSKLDATFALRPPIAPDATPLADRAVAGLSSDVAFFLTIARDQLDGYLDDLTGFPGDSLFGRVQTMAAVRREALIWAACVKSNAANAFWTYMRRYPRGPHLLDARRRLAAIHEALEPPPRFDMLDFAAPPPPDDLVLLGRHPLTLDDVDWAPLPPMPDGLIPPAPPDDIDLSVPQLAPAGALPLPMPRSSDHAGSITQPFVPGVGAIITHLIGAAGKDPVMDTSSAEALLSRTSLRQEADRRVVTQRDAHDAIISRTITTFGGDVVTSVQTGPSGGILRKVVTRTDPSGDHAMTISNGHNQIIATVNRDKTGLLTDMERGTVTVRDPTIIIGSGQDHAPRIEPALAIKPPLPDTAPTVAAAPAIPAPPPELKVEAAPPPPPPPPVAPALAAKPSAAQVATPLPPHRPPPNLKSRAVSAHAKATTRRGNARHARRHR